MENRVSIYRIGSGEGIVVPLMQVPHAGYDTLDVEYSALTPVLVEYFFVTSRSC